MEWTTTPPTVPGWYWVYTTAEDDGPGAFFKEIVEWQISAKVTLEEHGLLLTEHTHWLGPLPEPEPPK